MAPRSVHFKANSIIYFKGDHPERIYVLKQGSVSIKDLDPRTGKEIITKIKTGEFFGVKAVLGKFSYINTAAVTVDSELVCFDKKDFEALVLSNDRLTMKMLKVFSNQLRNVHKDVQQLMRPSVKSDVESGLFNIGSYYYRHGYPKRAIYALQQYLSYHPGGKFASEAEGLLARLDSTSSRKKEPVGLYSKAKKLFDDREWDEALSMYKEILKSSDSNSNRVQSYFECGVCLHELRMYKECVSSMMILVQKYSKYEKIADALYYIGASYMNLGDKGRAKEFLTRATQISSTSPLANKAMTLLGDL